ncbi:MAG: hypothetical protein U0974_01065 [Gemmatimonadales bacterium]|nr:hypothetical protein [Gemmatimonadales bacterium]
MGKLSDQSDPGSLPERMAYVSRRSDGTIVTVHASGSKILVYNPDGTLASTKGESGGGPGEFLRIRRVLVGTADTLIVSDWGQGRTTVLDESLMVVRTQTSTLLPTLALKRGRLLMAEHILTPDLIGYPLHTIGPDGEVERSFGTTRPEYSASARLATSRLATTAPDGSVWSVPPGRYMLEQWDPYTGSRLDSFEINDPAIVPIRSWPYDLLSRPPGIIESIWTDEQSRVFLLLRVADKAWQPRASGNAEVAYTADEYDITYDWIIHVVDPVSRRVVARLESAAALWGRPGSGVLTSRTSTGESELVEFVVVQPRLREGGVSQ